MFKTLRSLVVVASACAVGFAPSVSHGEDFFKGKVIQFFVGYSAGGSFDLYTRIIARHISKYIPGKPSAVVVNTPGAGGAIAANQVYKMTPDGLSVGAWASPLILQTILGKGAIKFDARELIYLGVPSSYETVCTFSKASGIKTANELFASPRTLKIGAIGPGTSTSDIPKILKEALNLPVQITDGYKGGADARMAVEQGEVDGYCGSWDTVESVWRTAYESGNVHAVLQTNLTTKAKYKHIPLAISYAKTEEARQLIAIADSANRAQFLYSLPPGVPKDRVAILREAFINALRDPELLAEAKKANLEIDPIDSPTVTRMVQDMYTMSPAMTTRLKDILTPKR